VYARFFSSIPSKRHPSRDQARLNASAIIRQIHRWLAIVFTLTVVANFAVRTAGEPPVWVTYSPLPPLSLMLFSGLYMFAMPYAAKRRSRRA
jgi:TRAP-type mannitol/chloroaromatic compound transport system permease small subunit